MKTKCAFGFLCTLSFFIASCSPVAKSPTTAPTTQTRTSTSTATFTPSPTLTPKLTATQTSTPTPRTHTPDPTKTVAPSPSPTRAIQFKPVSLNEFYPALAVLIPLSAEIPEEFVLANPEGGAQRYFWTLPEDVDIAKANAYPKNSFFAADISMNVWFDNATDRFGNAPNSMDDTETIQEYESQGAKVINAERVIIGEYPVLILELDLSSMDIDPTLLRKVHIVYIASLVETNVLFIAYYYSLAPDQSEVDAIWEHFRTSFERTPGVTPVPLVPYITTTPSP